MLQINHFRPQASIWYHFYLKKLWNESYNTKEKKVAFGEKSHFWGLNLSTLMTSNNCKNFAAHLLDPQQKNLKKSLKSVGGKYPSSIQKVLSEILQNSLLFWSHVFLDANQTKSVIPRNSQNYAGSDAIQNSKPKNWQKNILFSRH